MVELTQKRYLDPDELADTLNLSVRTVYRLAKTKAIPSYRAARVLRFDLDEVLAAMRSEPAA